jgi:alpha-galactosidase
MQCITLAAQKYSKTKTIGLCHGVTHSILKYCEWLGIDRKEVSVRCGGVNHFELVMEFVKDGKDLLPELIAKMDTLEIDGSEFGDLITKEMYKIFGALPTNHDIHSIEFYPHFLKRNTKLENYRLKQNNVAVRMSDGKKRWEKAYAYTKGEIPLDDIIKEHETEMLDSIIHTIVTNEPMVLDANITNNGCIRNLPDDVCVGVPVVLGRDGYKGVNVGEIPLGLDAMQYLHATIQKFIVDAAMTGNKQSIVKALTLDPMCYDLSYSERNNLIDDLLEIAKDYLPAFNK